MISGLSSDTRAVIRAAEELTTQVRRIADTLASTPADTRPLPWVMLGTRDLSIPDRAPGADEDQTLRWARRESLLVLLTRLQRGRTLTEDEARTLREHVEHEMREAEQLRAGRETWKSKAEEIEQDRDRTADDRDAADRVRAEAQRDRDQHAAVLREVLAAFVREVPGYRVPRRSAEADVETLEKWRSVVAPTAERPWWQQVAEVRAELKEAQAAIQRVRALLGGRWGSVDPDLVRAALDGTEQNTTKKG